MFVDLLLLEFSLSHFDQKRAMSQVALSRERPFEEQSPEARVHDEKCDDLLGRPRDERFCCFSSCFWGFVLALVFGGFERFFGGFLMLFGWVLSCLLVFPLLSKRRRQPSDPLGATVPGSSLR